MYYWLFLCVPSIFHTWWRSWASSWAAMVKEGHSEMLSESFLWQSAPFMSRGMSLIFTIGCSMDGQQWAILWGRPLFHLQCIKNAALHVEHTGPSSVTVILFYYVLLNPEACWIKSNEHTHTHVVYSNYACDIISNCFVLTMVQLSQGIPHNRSMSGVQSDPGLVRLPGVGCISITRMKPIKPMFF